MEQNSGSKASYADAISSIIRVRWIPTVPLTDCGTPLKIPQDQESNPTTNAGGKTQSPFWMPPNVQGKHVKSYKSLYWKCHSLQGGAVNCRPLNRGSAGSWSYWALASETFQASLEWSHLRSLVDGGTITMPRLQLTLLFYTCLILL